MKQRTFLTLLAAATPAFAQSAPPSPVSAITPVPLVMPAPTPAGTMPSPTPDAVPSATPVPVETPAPTPSTDGKIRLNFQGAQFSDVLNYLSETCGFVVVQDSPVSGTVNVISRQALTPDEAVDLLNSLLVEKNLTAIRNGRILKIVSRTDAPKRDLPVITGADPTQIPRNDNMVTQILPVRYADVSKLIDNLRPLLSDEASITANDASNAIILTDSQTNVHRIAEIIRALDTSISGISSIHVFPLQYADAKSISDVITQLFQTSDTSNGNNRQSGGGFPGFFGGFGGGRRGGGGGGGGEEAAGQSAARSAASRVVAVSDAQSNSVIVSAPDEYMPGIADIVSRLDTNVAAVSETRIFQLQHADCGEMATILTTLYGDTTGQTGSNNNNRNNGGNMFRFGGPQQPQQNSSSAQSQRQLQEARVVTVADPRTNSVIVTCSHDTMEEVAVTIGRLDSTDAKKQHIQVYTLQNADPDNVASILRGMFTVNGASTTETQNTTDVLSQRTQTGASSDVINTLNTSGNSSGGGGGGGGGGFGGGR